MEPEFNIEKESEKDSFSHSQFLISQTRRKNLKSQFLIFRNWHSSKPPSCLAEEFCLVNGVNSIMLVAGNGTFHGEVGNGNPRHSRYWVPDDAASPFPAISAFSAEVLALKHESRILGLWSNPVSGSRKSHTSFPWAKQYRF